MRVEDRPLLRRIRRGRLSFEESRPGLGVLLRAGRVAGVLPGLDEALAASSRALPKVSGPRRIRVLQTRSDIFAARGDAAAAREALEQALAYAESLPPGQRRAGTIEALKKKLQEPPAKTPAS